MNDTGFGINCFLEKKWHLPVVFGVVSLIKRKEKRKLKGNTFKYI